MQWSIYKNLGLGDPKPSTMWLSIVDLSLKRLIIIVDDVLVKVESFIFPTDFLILDFEVDYEVPIILGDHSLPLGVN